MQVNILINFVFLHTARINGNLTVMSLVCFIWRKVIRYCSLWSVLAERLFAVIQ